MMLLNFHLGLKFIQKIRSFHFQYKKCTTIGVQVRTRTIHRDLVFCPVIKTEDANLLKVKCK